MKQNKISRKIPFSAWISLAVSLGVIVGGFFFPLLGLFVPLLLVIAVVTNIRRERWFCGNACPRGKVLSGFLPQFSRYADMPAFLYAPRTRKMICAFLMFCAIGQSLRRWTYLSALGWFFWLVCIITLVIAFVMAFVYKPRSWCAVCPMGTLQQTMKGK
jgi:hypothetical protein